MAIITLLSLVSFRGLDTGGIDWPYTDKLVHFVFHAVGAFLGSLWLCERSRQGLSRDRALWQILAFLLLYGIIIEVLQDRFTTWRSAEVADVAADLLGALAGAAAIKVRYTVNWQLK